MQQYDDVLGDVERLSVRDVRTISLLNAGQALIFSSGLGTMLTMCARAGGVPIPL